jgi:hypothetical protein
MTAVPRVFLDASVLIAAAASRKGASSVVLAICGRGLLQALATQQVLREAERNIELKLGDDALLRFYAEARCLLPACSSQPGGTAFQCVGVPLTRLPARD